MNKYLYKVWLNNIKIRNIKYWWIKEGGAFKIVSKLSASDPQKDIGYTKLKIKICMFYKSSVFFYQKKLHKWERKSASKS